MGKRVPVEIQQIYFRNSYSQNLQNKQTKFMSVTGFFPPNFLVRKFSRFLQIFGRFLQKNVEAPCPQKIDFLTRKSSILRHVRLIEVTITLQKSRFVQSGKVIAEVSFLAESGKVGESQGIHIVVRENHNIIITLVREKRIVIQ